MIKKPPAAPDETAALARDLVDTIAAISTPTPAGPAGAAAGLAASGPGPRWSPDFSGPREILENGARFVSPVLPADARLRAAKALLLRAFRVVTRDQTVFNSAVLEALRGTLVTAERVLRDHAAAEASAREGVGHDLLETQKRTDALEKDRDERAKAVHQSLEGLAHDLLETQKRTDALEKDRDERAESVHRSLEGLAHDLRAAREEIETRDLAGHERLGEHEALTGARFAEEVRARHAALDGVLADLARETAAREREAAAREALGRELLETQRRLDALESSIPPREAALEELRGDLVRETAAREQEGAAREALGRELIEAERRLDALERSGLARDAVLEARLVAGLDGLRGELLREAAAREREAAAREALGREVVDTQRRVGSLESGSADWSRRLGAEADSLRGELGREVVAREQEGAAREALGHELVEALKRLDVLEGGTDARHRDVLAGLAALREAREVLGQEILGAQRRIDGLERDRDARGEALAGLDATREDVRALRLEWTALRKGLRRAAGTPAPKGRRLAPAEGIPSAADPLRAGLYADFERAFRGSEEEIKERQRKDVALFPKSKKPVADLGCGRGEFLELLKEAGLPGVGCDSNPVMVARSREKGLDVAEADLFDWLRARPDGSLSGVTAYQVVEHLPPAALFDLVELAVSKLAKGGRVLFETVNPESVYAMKWFWMDLTHVRPVPAPSLARLLEASGLKKVTVDYRSPVPGADALPPEAEKDPAFASIQKLLFAPQDYAVTGVK